MGRSRAERVCQACAKALRVGGGYNQSWEAKAEWARENVCVCEYVNMFFWVKL